MGRAGRRAVLQTPSPRTSRGVPWIQDHLQRVPSSNYSAFPQGPPREEDGETNPDAQEITSMTPGQLGKDTQGRYYQLLDFQNQYLLLLSLDDDLVFRMPSSQQPTLLRETVGYPAVSRDVLIAYARQDWGATWEDGLLLMKQEGRWDLQLRDGDRTHTQISQYTLLEEDSTIKYKEHASPQRAREHMEHVAANIETVLLCQQWIEAEAAGNLPAHEDRTDRIRDEARQVLLGRGDRKKLLAEIGHKDALLRIFIQDLPDPVPAPGTREFQDRIAPIWRRVSRRRF